MDKALIQKAQDLIRDAQNIVITTHRSPDGDAIGSSLALWHYLNKLGKSSVVVVPNAYPEFLKWLPGQDLALDYEHHKEEVTRLVESADLIFALDYNALHRTGDLSTILEKAKAKFILIDHHQQPEDFAEVLFSDTASCSTAQLIYDFIEASGDKDKVDATIGECIYCGIMTDSGSFRFPSVTPRTHRIAADLIEAGMDHATIHRNVYDTNVLRRLQLLGYALSNKLHVIPDLHTAYITLSQKELNDHEYRKGDTEGLVNYALSLKGVNFAAFMREGNNEVKLSFRSKGVFNVNEYARTEFDGGGHNNASGGASSKSLEEVKKHFVDSLERYRDKLNY